MAYNTSKGPRGLGDIKNEDDPDTQIDFGSDSIALTTSGSARLTVTNTSVTSAVALTASAFSGDGSALQGITGSGFRSDMAIDLVRFIDFSLFG